MGESSPDLIGDLAAALERARQELNALTDLSEQVQATAGHVITYTARGVVPPREKTEQLRVELDRLMRWQIAEVRRDSEHQRARVRGLLERVPA